MNGPITETAIFGVRVTFDAFKSSGARFNSGTQYGAVLQVDGVNYYYSSLPLTFYWEVGSSHSVWWLDVYAHESPYLSGAETWYKYDYSSGIFTSQKGTLTVPSGGGSVTAYYKRYITIDWRGIDPGSQAGSVSPSPSTGWYLEGTGFTATANTGYQFHHWVLSDSGDTSSSNPYYAWYSSRLKAVFYIGITFYAYDKEDYYIKTWTNYYPSGYNYISVPSSTYAFGYYVDFWKWSDGTTSTTKYVYVYQPTLYTVYYKTPITTLQKEFVGEVGYSGIPTDFVAQGYVKSVHGNKVAGVKVHATFYISGWLGSATREADATSTDYWAYYGKFIEDVYDPWAVWNYDIQYVKLDVTGVPDGYQDCAGIWYWYP
jgi:hypothetical protein